jgi:hypothetical protein
VSREDAFRDGELIGRSDIRLAKRRRGGRGEIVEAIADIRPPLGRARSLNQPGAGGIHRGSGRSRAEHVTAAEVVGAQAFGADPTDVVVFANDTQPYVAREVVLQRDRGAFAFVVVRVAPVAGVLGHEVDADRRLVG